MQGRDRSRADTGLEGEVESSEAFAFQRRSWTIERVAWVAMALLVVAGLFGLFGGGPLGQRTLYAGGIELRHDAFARLGTPALLDLRVTPSGEGTRVTLASRFFARIRVEHVWPTPERIEASGEWTTFHLASRGPGPLHVRVAIVPEEIGLLDGSVRSEAGDALPFRVLVYP